MKNLHVLPIGAGYPTQPGDMLVRLIGDSELAISVDVGLDVATSPPLTLPLAL